MVMAVSGLFEDLKFKISEDYKFSCLSAETAYRAEAGKLKFWSKPSEILNLRSSNAPHTN
jgi:hypothetical protein